MVRGKVQAKSAATKRSSGSKSSTTAKSPHIGATISSSPSTSTTCCSCKILITDDVCALQCDKCQSGQWKCIECLSLPAELYEQLLAEPQCNLRWFCDKCDRSVMEADLKSDNSASGQNDNTDKIDKLLAVAEKLVDKLADVEDKLKGKCDTSTAEQLKLRIDNLEERLYSGEMKVEHRLAAVDEHMSKLVTDRMKAAEVGTKLAEPANAVEQAVKEEIIKQIEEDKDIENRKCNIIIYKVPEDLTAEFSTRKDNDLQFITDMLDIVFHLKLQNTDIEKFFRLGKFSRDAEVARPLLVRFADVGMKDEVMSNVRKLRETVPQFSKVSISHDLTPRQREERKSMVAAAKKDHVDQCTEDVENFQFLVVGQGTRKKVIKVRRQN